MKYLYRLSKLLTRLIRSSSYVLPMAIFIFVLPVGYTYAVLPEFSHEYLRDKSSFEGRFDPFIGEWEKIRGSEYLDIQLIPGLEKEGRRAVVIGAPWAFDLEGNLSNAIPGNAKTLRVPVSQRFVTDFASIPFFARWLISPFGKHAEAAIVHDWHYAVGDALRSKEEADAIFYLQLRDDGVGLWRASVMYASVRLWPKIWLFKKPSFGSEKEWDFYDPFLEAPVPDECRIPNMDDYLYDETQFKPVLEPANEKFENGNRTLSTSYFRPTNFFGDQWLAKFSRGSCLVELGELYARKFWWDPTRDFRTLSAKEKTSFFSGLMEYRLLPSTDDHQFDSMQNFIADHFNELSSLLISQYACDAVIEYHGEAMGKQSDACKYLPEILEKHY